MVHSWKGKEMKEEEQSPKILCHAWIQLQISIIPLVSSVLCTSQRSGGPHSQPRSETCHLHRRAERRMMENGASRNLFFSACLHGESSTRDETTSPRNLATGTLKEKKTVENTRLKKRELFHPRSQSAQKPTV